jgi:uncharacterized iron-regulated membrane protein
VTRSAFQKWIWVHRWSGLVCTAFLLLICVTGLPLIFSEEIRDWSSDSQVYADLPAGTPNVSFDRLAELSRQIYPGEIIVSIFIDNDEPKASVLMAPSWQEFNANRKVGHSIRFDVRTAQVLKQLMSPDEKGPTFMGVLLRLHTDIFAGLPGELFMAGMALMFVVAVVSCIVIYGPFMKKVEFGTIRTNRSLRLKWLDLHNLFGVVTIVWALVVGVTGIMNELATPLFALWRQTDVKKMLEPFKNTAIPAKGELSSIQSALDTAKAAVPGTTVISVIYPGADVGTPFHYLVWTKGREPLASRLFTPVLIDARSGQLSAVVTMPWYLRALQVSRPLHFGDYGGLPLKMIWALLNLMTIIILGSGLYLWRQRSALVSTIALESKSDTGFPRVREPAG